MPKLKYLSGYPDDTQNKVRQLIEQNRLGDYLAKKYPQQHSVQSDKALYQYAMELKSQYMRNAPLINSIEYDGRLDVVQRALGTNTAISRVQGGKLTAKKEIRIDAVFKSAAPEFLRMIVVHELAHLKERNHDKAFYKLCEYMEPQYHQLEFDLRLYLTHRETP